jgi:DNA-directed RNA polymerase subunit M/transcription elongation factor TFIIS
MSTVAERLAKVTAARTLEERVTALEKALHRQKLEVRLEQLRMYGYRPAASESVAEVCAVAAEARCPNCGELGQEALARCNSGSITDWSLITFSVCPRCGFWEEI